MSRRLFVLAGAVVWVSCVDFDQALSTCEQPGHRCTYAFADGGTTDAGAHDGGANEGGLVDAGEIRDAGQGDSGTGALDAGVFDAGVFDAGPLSDAGTKDGGGGGGDGGVSCTGCITGSTCVAAPANMNDATCGAPGGQCQACGGGLHCSVGYACSAAKWSLIYTQQNNFAQRSISATTPTDLWFAGANTSFVHIVNGVVASDQYLGAMDAYGVASTGNSGSANVYIVGRNAGYAVLQGFSEPYDGGDAPGPRFQIGFFSKMWGVFSSGKNVFAVGESTEQIPSVALMYQVQADFTWQDVTSPLLKAPLYGGVGVNDADFYLLSGAPSVVHMQDGGITSVALLPDAPQQMSGTGSKLWVVGPYVDAGPGYFGTVVNGHYNDVKLSGLTSPNFTAVSVAPDGVVFGAAYTPACAGLVFRYDGALESTCVSPAVVQALYAVSGGEAWAGDHDGGIFHYSP